jgi:hypothetical protein
MQRWFTPEQVLRMATSNSAELLALSGPRSPYRGRLGVAAGESAQSFQVPQSEHLDPIIQRVVLLPWIR